MRGCKQYVSTNIIFPSVLEGDNCVGQSGVFVFSPRLIVNCAVTVC